MSDLYEFFKSITIFTNPMWKSWLLHAFFYKQCFSSIEPQCCLTFSWIELQMLPTCFHITYKHHYTKRHISHIAYFGPCLGLGLFMSYIGDLFFIFSLIFITINSITPLKQAHLFYAHFLDYLLLFLYDNVDEESK